ncbi:MAG TPA: hypothetical protein VEE84_01475 [Burkholderiaceae bacterium]|nr:hypothetical protein [Burkholderiaceae bacterium]
MQIDCVRRGQNIALRLVPLVAMAAFAGGVSADQEVQSSDGQWKVHAKVADSLAVKKSGEAMIDITAAGMAKGCPKVTSVAFEMPAHGHGGDVDPKVMSMGACSWHVTDLEPSMSGAWRLRLVLKDGDKTSNADIAITAK